MPQDKAKKQQTHETAKPYRAKACSWEFCKKSSAQQASEQLKTLRLAELGNFRRKLHKGHTIFLHTKPRKLTFI